MLYKLPECERVCSGICSQVTFLIEGIEREDLTKDGDLALSISKEEAKKLAEKLLSMV